MWIFFDWYHKWSSFWAILAHAAWPRTQLLGQSVSLKFSLETRIKSESFEPLINFLACLDHKLWYKINKLINKLISHIFTSLDHNFWTRNLSRSSKVSKDSDCSLVSSRNFSKILPPNSWRPGPGKVGQGGLKVLYLRRHSQKNCTPKQKIFFDCRLEDLPCLLTLQPGLWPVQERRYSRTKPHAFRLAFSENPRKQPDIKMLNIIFSQLALKGKPGVVWFQQKRVLQTCHCF